MAPEDLPAATGMTSRLLGVTFTLASRGASFPEAARATVFSTHERAINLVVSTSDELLSITTSLDSMTVTSLGVLPPPEFADLRNLGLARGAPVTGHRGLIEFGRSRLVLREAARTQTFDGTMRVRGTGAAGEASAAAFSMGRDALLEAIVERATGAGFAPIAVRLATGNPSVDPDNPFAAAAWARLQDASPGAGFAALQRLIGLGPGLTPSGDDFVVGALAAIRARGAAARTAGLDADSTAALRARLASTTRPGATIISQALRGCFPAYLCRFAEMFSRALEEVDASLPPGPGNGAYVGAPPGDSPYGSDAARALISAAIGEAARHGSTSGIDALTGFAWGLPTSA